MSVIPMSRLLGIAGFALGLCFGPARAETGACPTLAKGRWTVTSIYTDPISPIDYKRALATLGKPVIIDAKQAAFPGKTCDIYHATVRKADTSELELTKSYGTEVYYECRMGFGAMVYVGAGCGEVLAHYDGVWYQLSRVRVSR